MRPSPELMLSARRPAVVKSGWWSCRESRPAESTAEAGAGKTTEAPLGMRPTAV